MVSTKSSNVNDFSADVVVIGGGGAGLPAAVSAAEAGEKVILIEYRNILGGTARMSGSLFGVETAAQRRQGITHSADEFYRIHMDRHNWKCNARLVRDWMMNSGKIMRWYEGMGLEFTSVTSSMSTNHRTTHRVADGPSMVGNEMMKALIKQCEKLGVQVLLGTRGRKLLTDGKGTVTGVLAAQKDKEIRIEAKSTIIATGSITANKDLMKKYFPEINPDKMKVMAGVPASTGDGFIMAQEVGSFKYPNWNRLLIGPCNHPMNIRTGMVIRRPHMMFVNKHGLRYTDESLWTLNDAGWFSAEQLDQQPDKVCYGLLDDKTLKDMIRDKKCLNGMEDLFARTVARHDVMESSGGEAGIELQTRNNTAWLGELEEDIKSEAEAGRIKISNSLDEIAQWIGADPTVLKNSVNEYNTYCQNGYDADFLKPQEWLFPVSTPPYYAFRALQALDSAMGGITINHRMEVVNDDLERINGLYAGGIATSGWYGCGCDSVHGQALSFSSYSGYAAGKNAAAYARSVGK